MSKNTNPLMPSRLAKRMDTDKKTIYNILDEALHCTISYVEDNKPFAIPTAFVRYDDKIYIHGSVGSHFIRAIEKGLPVCISVTLMDALVVARSAFHHSVNYRSVILFSTAELIEDIEMKKNAFEWLINKMVPQSWEYLRQIKEGEINKTTVLAFDIDQAAAKIRTGMPIDDEEDIQLPIWSGIIPMETRKLSPIADEYSRNIPLPEHLS